MKFLVILCIIFLSSCHTQESKSKIQTKKPLDTLHLALIGKWGGLNEKEPVWRFSADSVYYYQENKSYSYTISNKTLLINRNGATGGLKNVSITKDTMSFEDPPGVHISAYRFHEK